MSVLDGPGEGTWSVFAAKVVEERDKALAELAGLRDWKRHVTEALRDVDLPHTRACPVFRDDLARRPQVGLLPRPNRCMCFVRVVADLLWSAQDDEL